MTTTRPPQRQATKPRNPLAIRPTREQTIARLRVIYAAVQRGDKQAALQQLAALGQALNQ